MHSGEKLFYSGRPSRISSLGSYFIGFLFLLGAPLIYLLKRGALETPIGPTSVGTIVAWVVGFIGFVILVRAEIFRLFTKYTITDMRIIRRDGLIRHTTQYVVMNKVERIAVDQGLIDRLIGLGDILVDAGDDHIILSGVRDPRRIETGIARTLSLRR